MGAASLSTLQRAWFQPGAAAEQSRLGDQDSDILRDSSHATVWGLHQLSFLAWNSGGL